MTSTVILEAAGTTWHEANQRYLSAAFARVRHRLEKSICKRSDDQTCAPALQEDEEIIAERDAWNFSRPPALVQLCSSFELSSFERDLLLLCASAEMDSGLAQYLASIGNGLLPTFGLALATLQEAHWSALCPTGALRYWQLIELLPADTLVSHPLRINERVLHYLAGVPSMDERLQGVIRPLPQADVLPFSYLEIARQIATVWAETADLSRGSTADSALPFIELCGHEPESARAIAAEASALLNLRPYILHIARVPQSYAAETNLFFRLWEREAVLDDVALMIEIDERNMGEAPSSTVLPSLPDLIHSPLILSSPRPLANTNRPHVIFQTRKPTRKEQAEIWGTTLATEDGDSTVESLVSQFSLAPTSIRSAAHRADGIVGRSGSPSDYREELWDACRIEGRSRLEGLAQRIESSAVWDDLILLEKDKEILRRIAVHMRQRTKVYETWGFSQKGARGLGISALFAGASGTGKTMAAEVLAHELRLDLFRIDLSQVVSKYIGETEKNLGCIFDAAEESASILLFDEADALFGKRSEIKDSHDRYANVEVSYLLQRMESYRGLAILTTNRKNALDHAFLRRIRFVLDFSFPEAAQRAEMWRRAFPASTPTEDLRFDCLARLHVTGGNIQNIAMGAAFLAADAQQPVRMEHLLASARSEFAKLEKPLTDSEISRWV